MDVNQPEDDVWVAYRWIFDRCVLPKRLDASAKQPEMFDRKIAEHLAQYQSDLLTLLKTVKEVGQATAATMISELPELGQLETK
jgi:hypothetical protein